MSTSSQSPPRPSTPPPTEGPRLLRTFGSVLVARIGSAGISALTLGLLARTATTQEFGIAGSAIGVFTLATTAGDLGITSRVVVIQAAQGAGFHPRLARLMRLNTALAEGIALLAGATLTTLFAVTGSLSYLFLLPLSVSIILERQAEFRSAVALGLFRQELASRCLLLRRTATIIVLTPALLTGQIHPLACYSLATLAGAAVGARFISRRIIIQRVRLSLTAAIQDIRECLPYLWNTLGSQLRNLDATLISLLCTPSISAIYSVPGRLITPLRIIPTSLATAILPYASARKPDSSQTILRALLITLLATYTLFSALYVLAPQFLTLLAGHYYLNSAPTLRILLVGLAFASISSSLTSILQTQGYANTVARISVISGLATLVTIAILTPRFRAEGAAVAVSAGYSLQFALLTARVLHARKKHTSGGIP